MVKCTSREHSTALREIHHLFDIVFFVILLFRCCYSMFVFQDDGKDPEESDVMILADKVRASHV